MDTLRALEILITSRTPLIAIETLEEERVAQRLRIPIFVWTMTRAEEVEDLREWARGRAVPAS